MVSFAVCFELHRGPRWHFLLRDSSHEVQVTNRKQQANEIKRFAEPREANAERLLKKQKTFKLTSRLYSLFLVTS